MQHKTCVCVRVCVWQGGGVSPLCDVSVYSLPLYKLLCTFNWVGFEIYVAQIIHSIKRRLPLSDVFLAPQHQGWQEWCRRKSVFMYVHYLLLGESKKENKMRCLWFGAQFNFKGSANCSIWQRFISPGLFAVFFFLLKEALQLQHWFLFSLTNVWVTCFCFLGSQ